MGWEVREGEGGGKVDMKLVWIDNKKHKSHFFNVVQPATLLGRGGILGGMRQLTWILFLLCLN